MPMQSLEVLRLLTNLETEKRKLLQVVLFGQPELNDNLRHFSVRQLRQRISFQYELKGLRKDELDRYLRHRVAIAGYAGETLFHKSAVAKLQRITRGTPRLINIVAHKALMLAFGEGRQQVFAKHIQAAAVDTPEVSRDWLPVALGLTATVLVAAAIISWLVLR
jgi:MSHA biogenesis protein MshM